MRTLTTMIAVLAFSGSAYAAKTPKHDVAKCTALVVDALQIVAKDSKSMSVSHALTDKQYAFIKKEAKEHSKQGMEAPGDGAFIVKSDDSFIVFFIKGADADAKVCAVMAIPPEVVVGVLKADGFLPINPEDKPESKSAPWL